MIDPGMTSPATNITARLQTLRWLLPLILFSVVVIYEVLAYSVAATTVRQFSFWWEVLLFGLAGPVTVGLVLNWMAGQMRERVEAELQLQISLAQLKQAEETERRSNETLEQRVAERTQKLLDAYQKVAEQNEMLQTLDQLKSEFVSLVSHELRAPLTNINGGIELILAFDDALDPDVGDSLQVMKQESERLTRLVENILNVSALEAGQLKLKLEPVELSSLVKQTVENYLISTPNLDFQVEVKDDLPLAVADEAYMHDIIFNLIDNAVKYTQQPVGAEIKVVVGYDRLEDKDEAGTIWISVIDKGLGIPPDDQERIFAPFHRLDGQENRKVYGHGLGLYFAHKLVEAQGGEIRLESTPGQGSCFTVSLPVVSSIDLEEGIRDEVYDLID